MHEEDKIFNIGCPRTDLFFNNNIIQERKDNFFQIPSNLSNKKIILYAPTFQR